MISSTEIKKKAFKSYPVFLSALVNSENLFPMEVRGNKVPSKSLVTHRKEMEDLQKSSKQNATNSYTIDFVKTKTRFIGSQSLPKRIFFDTEKDFVGYLNKTNEVKSFKNVIEETLKLFPELKTWMSTYPLKVIANLKNWRDILKVVGYFQQNPKPRLYIRELPIRVHTKFIEDHKSVLRELLDIINADTLNTDEQKHFETRFHLKYSEPLVRFRLLDSKIAQSHYSELEDITVRLSDFSTLKLPIDKVLVVENLMNLLTLPMIENTMAIFGKGFNSLSLKNIDWLSGCEIYYWGDLDAQGFEILSGFRSHYKHTKSLMMDKTTFDKFYENDLETKSKIETLLYLNEEEHDMHQLLFKNKWRLEQEKIPMDYTLTQLKKLTKTP